MCESVPEPRAPVILQDLVRAGASRPLAVLLSSPAGGRLSHSLSAVTAFPLCGWVSAAQAVPGKSQAWGSFPGWELHHAPSQATPSVRLLSPGREGGGERGRHSEGLLTEPTEPFCCWEAFPCLSQTLLFVPWESSVLEEGLCVL